MMFSGFQIAVSDTAGVRGSEPFGDLHGERHRAARRERRLGRDVTFLKACRRTKPSPYNAGRHVVQQEIPKR
jgi:hypothetical protein